MRLGYVVLGASGYIGQAFVEELSRRDLTFASVSRSQVDYTRYARLVDFLRESKAKFLINCAGYTGKPNVDTCERAKNATLLGNVVLVETIANACESAGISWGHVSSGCIYSGAKIRTNGATQVARDLLAPDVLPIWQHDRTVVSGFTEEDPPNFTFDSPPCSFYSGTKAAAETLLRERDNLFVWRLRIPFDHRDNPRNYLSKLLTYPMIYDNVNSLSHRGDFASACIDCWEHQLPFGTYNMTNPGWLTTRDIVTILERNLAPGRDFHFFRNDHEFYRIAAAAPRSNAVLDSTKLASKDISLRPVRDAVYSAIATWSGKRNRSVAHPG